MNSNIIKLVAKENNISEKQVETVLKMLEEGATVPFIARYRKEATGALSEDEIRSVETAYKYQLNLNDRKEDVIRLIDEKKMLTDELKESIMKCERLVDVEDLYRPYKEKKKTKGLEAINKGLEPLAKIIMSFPVKGTIDELAEKYVNDKVKSKDEAKEGAGYIIAEWISDNAYLRKSIRKYTYLNGELVTKKKNSKEDLDPEKIYDMYYDFKESIKYAKTYRILAINRAEKEKIITVKIDVDEDSILNYLESKVIKNKESFVVPFIKDVIKDSYKRLIKGSIERDIRSELTEKAEKDAIKTFSNNLESLLLTPPLKEKVVLAFDPGFVNGCKLAVIDKTGKYMASTVIKPFLKNISPKDFKKCKEVVKELIERYNVEIISIGNGTASRESEKFCSELIKEYNLNCKYVIVSEAGASIYSASDVAKEELGDLAIEKRSAVSIGRRLQDPLSELVKIPPDGIGVGMYQHDMPKKELKESLDFTTEKCVNSVGVNVNTASVSLLSYVSGLTKKMAEKIIDFRDKHGKFKSREELKKDKLLTPKAYEQAIGFLKIQDGTCPLDKTNVHPESYDIAENLLKSLGLSDKDLGTKELKEKLKNVNIEEEAKKLNTDKYTLKDIIENLEKPNLDPRDEYPQPILKSDILELKDLYVGEKLEGTVRNVAPFGLFIDIGLHDDGLAHISKLSKSFVKDPNDLYSVGDIVTCYVDSINKEKEKVNLRMYE